MSSSRPGAVRTPEEARLERVSPQIDRAQRVAAMLDRWQTEDVSDEPDWEASEVEDLALRPHST